MEGNYIACLTSYPKRMNNLPKVIESIWSQSVKPDKVVLTIARKDMATMQPVLDVLDCDVLVVENDVKVFKKFLYAMERYCKNGDDLILACDDDKLYDSTNMIENMLDMHGRYGKPVSGNLYWHNGLNCHCGCASLVYPACFEGWRKYEKYFDGLESSDMFYTMLAADNHHTYISDLPYNEMLTDYNECDAYSRKGMVQRTYVKMAKLLKWI